MKHILHILPYDSVHLALSLIRRFNQEFSFDGISHDFILYGKRDDDKDAKYDKLGEDLSISFTFIESVKALYQYLKRINNYSIIIHGDSFHCIKQSVRTNNHVNWICWGYIPQKGKRFLLSNVSFFLRKRTYQRLRNIVCLLSGDKNEIIRLYKLTNIMVLPYNGAKNDENWEKCRMNKHIHKPLNVYIGNSGYVYQSYLDLLPQLAKYKGFIRVHVMFQYPDWPDKKEIVRALGKELFDDDFILDETMMDMDTYREYMSQCDIYICGDKLQTGLGAIQFSLYVGTKVYISGKNLEWKKELGAIVFDVDNIKNMSFAAFSRELLPAEKEHNKNVMISLWDQRDNWIDFLKNKC